MTVPILRVARPTGNLPVLLRFYGEGLGLEQLAAFRNHNGFDGVMLGRLQAPCHLEFTHQPGYGAGRTPTADNLLVLCLPRADEWQAAVPLLEAAGIAAMPAQNSCWDHLGRTFEGPDGYRVVLQQAEWKC